MTSSSLAFSQLGLRPELTTALTTLNYQLMTPIQAQSLPAILSGKDVIGQGKTGSGKTAAFALGLLQSLQAKQFTVQALVLCPTRELADQVAAEIRRLATAIENIKILSLCGGSPFKAQANSLQYGAHIVVGTPGRIEEHLRRETLQVDTLQTLVLDEADRMLDMGFEESLNNIIEMLPQKRQTLLFSATFPESIQSIAKHVLSEPVHVKVASTHDQAILKQHFYQIADDEERKQAVKLLLMAHNPTSAVVFCNTKKEVKTLTSELAKDGFSVCSLHGEMEQRERDQTLVQFANQSALVLVATDVAARGLDIDTIEMVINYHLAHDPEVHIHRIGRTGRAGKNGFAASLFRDGQDYKLALLSDTIGQEIVPEALPGLQTLNQVPPKAPMVTLLIDAGKKQKIRPGDILGALTGEGGIVGEQVGKIKVTAQRSFVAVTKKASQKAINKLSQDKIKGKKIRARFLSI